MWKKDKAVDVRTKRFWWFHKLFKTKYYKAALVMEFMIGQENTKKKLQEQVLQHLIYGDGSKTEEWKEHARAHAKLLSRLKG